MIYYFFVVMYAVVLTFVLCIIRLGKIDKKTIISLITCNTILYCVLYSQCSIFIFIIQSIVTSMLAIISYYDIKYKCIRNTDICIVGGLGLVLKIVNFLLHNQVLVVESLINIIVTYLIYIFSKRKIGGGDIKLLMVLSLFVGINEYLYIIFIACIFGIVYGIVIRIINNKSINKEFAFGECISLAFIVIKIILKR